MAWKKRQMAGQLGQVGILGLRNPKDAPGAPPILGLSQQNGWGSWSILGLSVQAINLHLWIRFGIATALGKDHLDLGTQVFI